MGYMTGKSRGFGPPPPRGSSMGNGGTGGGSPIGGSESGFPTQVQGPVYSQGGLGPTGGGDPRSQFIDPPTQVENVPTGGGSPNAQSGAAFSSMLGPPPTQAMPETGGGSPNPLAGNAMQQQMANIGGFRAPITSPTNPTQAPQVETGGGSPNENMIPPHMLAQALNMPDGPDTGFTPNQGMVNMNRIAAGSAPAAYGGGGTNWQDRPIGPMRTGPAPPMGSTAPPAWAATNPAMWNLLGGNPFSTGVNNGRGPWWNERG